MTMQFVKGIWPLWMMPDLRALGAVITGAFYGLLGGAVAFVLAIVLTGAILGHEAFGEICFTIQRSLGIID